MDQIAMCYISMDLSQRALQSNGKLFSNLGILFKLAISFVTIFQNNSGIRFMQARWGQGRHLCWTAHILVL